MLTSLKNPKIAAAARLRKRAFREQDRRFLVEGAQGVREGLEARALDGIFTTEGLDELALRARQEGLAVHLVGDDVMRKLTSTVTPQPILGTAPFVDVGLDGLPAGGCVTVLHEVRDPGNAGTVLRSADAAGAGGVVFTTTSVDVYNPKTVRASAGSVFHLPIVREVPTAEVLAHLRASGFRILAMDAEGSESLYGTDLDGPVAFVFGNEAHGLPQEVVAAADATVRVPHAGKAESLNLAAAATVCLFEWARRRIGHGQALEAIIAAAAHDIRSPLTAMKGFGYALETHGADMTEDQRALMLQGIVFDADRMDFVLRLLVDAARLTAGSLEVRREQTDLGEVVSSIGESQARDPDFPGIEWRGDAGPFFVDSDPAAHVLAVLRGVARVVGRRGPGRGAGGADRRAAARVGLARRGRARRGRRGDALPAATPRDRGWEQDRPVRGARRGGGPGRPDVGGGRRGTPRVPPRAAALALRGAAPPRGPLGPLLDSPPMDAEEMRRILEEERERGIALAAEASDLEALEGAQTAVLGRKTRFSEAQRSLGGLPHEQRKELGMLANEVREGLVAVFAARRDELGAAAETALLAADRVDLTLPGRRPPEGSLHPLTLVEREIVEVFTRLGFRVVEGPEIEDDWHNFQALNIPEDHPARTMKDSLYVAIPGIPSCCCGPRRRRCRSARCRRSLRPCTSSRRAACTGARTPTPPTWRCSTRSRRWSSTRGSPSPTSKARSRR